MIVEYNWSAEPSRTEPSQAETSAIIFEAQTYGWREISVEVRKFAHKSQLMQ